jgi:ABC-type Fe3+ transport system substrate-binding protein
MHTDTATETLLNNEPVFPENEDGQRRQLDFLGYASCPVRAELRRRLHAHLRRLTPEPRWYIPGGCHSDDAYDGIWQTTNATALPGLIADTGFGDFVRTEFVNRWLADDTIFAPIPAIADAIPADSDATATAALRPEFRDAGLLDPRGQYRVFGANIEIILVDLARLGDRPLPRTWADILHPRFQRDIIVSGDPQDLHESLLFGFYHDFGEAGLTALGANVRGFMHPAEMTKAAGSTNPRGAALYLLPDFFAAATPHRDAVRTIWPEDGAYLSPQYFLRRRDARPAATTIANFLCGAEWAAHLAKIGFAPARPGSPALRGPLRWLGWDFVRTHDLEALRAPLNAAYATTAASAANP